MLCNGRRSLARVFLQARAATTSFKVSQDKIEFAPMSKQSEHAPGAEANYEVWDKRNPNFKVSTMLTGVEVVPFCHDMLLEAYQATLTLLKRLPECGYRKRTEQLTAARMQLCMRTKNHSEIEAALECGRVEELLQQAYKEHALAFYMLDQFNKRTDPKATQNPTLTLPRQGDSDTDVAPHEQTFQTQEVDWKRELELNDAMTKMVNIEELEAEYATRETPTKRMLREYRVLHGVQEYEQVDFFKMDHEWRTAWYQRRFADDFHAPPPRVFDIYEPS